MTAFRCAAESLQRGDDLAGTASTVRAFLLIENGGPWGSSALRDCPIPNDITTDLAARARQHKVRPLLIRRYGRRTTTENRVFVARVDPGGSWMESTTFDDHKELLDIDLAALGADRSCGLTPYDESLFLVCTHGKHDVCCAERGRPVAAALTAGFPEQTWEVSHIGGDRFASNVLVLPQGLYYGRINPGEAVAFAADQVGGHLWLDRLRGRSCYAFAAQAAEIYLRRSLDRIDDGAVTLKGHRVDDDVRVVTFGVEGERWEVRVRSSHTSPVKLTCNASGEGRALQQELVSIAKL